MCLIKSCTIARLTHSVVIGSSIKEQPTQFLSAYVPLLQHQTYFLRTLQYFPQLYSPSSTILSKLESLIASVHAHLSVACTCERRQDHLSYRAVKVRTSACTGTLHSVWQRKHLPRLRSNSSLSALITSTSSIPTLEQVVAPPTNASTGFSASFSSFLFSNRVDLVSARPLNTPAPPAPFRQSVLAPSWLGEHRIVRLSLEPRR